MYAHRAAPLAGNCVKLMAKPLDKITQQSDRLVILRAASGLGLSGVAPCDQSFRCFHCAVGAKQVERGSSILDSCPDSRFGPRIRIGRACGPASRLETVQKVLTRALGALGALGRHRSWHCSWHKLAGGGIWRGQWGVYHARHATCTPHGPRHVRLRLMVAPSTIRWH